MNEMLSITLSLVGLVISLLTWIISFRESRKENYIHRIMQNITETMIEDHIRINSDLPEMMEHVSDILYILYPQAKFKISIKVLEKNDTSSDAFVKTFITYYDKHITCSESGLASVKENFALNSILYNEKRFFFVSDMGEYGRLNTNELSPYSFTTSASVIVFPIKKAYRLNSENVIGFLYLSSPEKLDNPKKNEILMKLLTRISSELYLPLQAAVPQLHDS